MKERVLVELDSTRECARPHDPVRTLLSVAPAHLVNNVDSRPQPDRAIQADSRHESMTQVVTRFKEAGNSLLLT